MVDAPQYSLILLVENKKYDFCERFYALHQKLLELGYLHELILAINGPGRFARNCMQKWPVEAPPVKIVELTRKVSSGICLQIVLPECKGDFLLICGPYQQIDYSGLGQILAEVNNGAVDLALPRREQRIDPPINRLQSWLFNWLVRRLTGTSFHDLSSMLRVVNKSILQDVPLYGDLYRYLPLLALRRGFKVKEYPVPHLQEKGRVGFLGHREYVSRLVDLLGMHFTFGFARKPLRYFGLRGLIVFLLGLSCMLYAVAGRFITAAGLGDSPQLMIGLLLMVVGSGICGIGLLGEILTFVIGRNRKEYIVEKILE